MSARQYDPDRSGDSGMTAAQQRVENQGWIFRRQNHADFGIDAHIEVTDGHRNPTGSLIGVQVKAGPSYFQEEKTDGYVFRPDEVHVRYWLHHTLPVLVFLVDLESNEVYWEKVSDDTLESTGKGWKMLIPKDNLIDEEAAYEIRYYARSPMFSSTRSHLALAQPLMEEARDGELILKANQWVNKSSGRGTVEFVTNRGGEQVTLAEWGTVWSPREHMGVKVEKSFPWADFEVDEEYYAVHENPEVVEFYQGMSLAVVSGVRDGNETDDLRPYDIGAGEVAFYRFRVALSELGESYLKVEEFIQTQVVPYTVGNGKRRYPPGREEETALESPRSRCQWTPTWLPTTA